jgi:alanine racemase
VSFGARALVRLDALKHNFRQIRDAAPDSRIMAVIKANAYGHGLLPVANGLPEADSFAVARLREALDLRDAGISQPIVLLAGVLSAEDLDVAVAKDFELVVHCEQQIEILEASAATGITVWLKLDSGMNRLGFPLQFAQGLQARLRNCDAVSELRLMSHLASADQLDDPSTRNQLAALAEVVPEFDGDVSIANSAAIFGWSEVVGSYHSRCSGASWVRAGICLYGISPFEGQTGSDLALKPVMQFESQLIAIKKVMAGGQVGYLGRWQAPTDTTVGIIAAGYGDGYLRFLPSGTPVFINGRRVPLAGVVSMDMAAVDLGSGAQDKVGDVALLWGDELPVEEVAQHAGTIPYQLVTGVIHREHSQQTG